MARSSYIYILHDTDGSILGAFTVKYEMITAAENLRAGYYVRLRDGHPGVPATRHNFHTDD